MGERIRAFDWAATSLGPMPEWPQSLRTAVDLLLHSPAPMVMLWGPDGVMIYNDGYSEFAGARHPRLLGSRVQEGWPEVADFNRRVMEVGLGGGTLSFRDQQLVLYRNGVAEDVWMNLDYSPIRDESGRPAGVFAIVVETSGRVRAEAALRDSEARLRQANQTLEQANKELVGEGERLSTLFGAEHEAKAALRESQAYLRLVLDSTGEGFYAVDREGVTTLCNAAFVRLLGFKNEQEAVGRKLHGVIHHSHPDGESYAKEDCPIYQCAKAGAPAQVEGELFFRLDGTSFPVEYAAAPIWRDGELQGAICTFADMTERQAAQVALRLRAEEFRALADNIPTLCWMAHADGNIFWYNRRWYEYTGATPESQKGWGWEAVHDPEMLPSVVERWTHSIATGEPFEMTFPLKGGDGRFHPFLTRVVPIRDEAGEIVRWFGTNVDVSEQQRFAEELKRLVTQRTAERDRIWNTSSELMAVGGLDGYLKSVNPAWTRVLGHDEATLLARPFTDLIHPDDLAAAGEMIEVLGRGRPIGRFEDRLRDAEGAWRWISWTATPGEGVFYAVGRDVTEEKQVAEELQATEESLRQAQKMEAVGQLTGGIAHDFNNLLTAVVGGLDMIQRRAPDERTKRLAANAMQAAERGAKLTSQLLAFSRTQRLAVEPVRVNAAIGRMRDLLTGAAGSTVQLNFELEPDLGAALTDANQLELAVLNLVINARDAMGGKGAITICTARARVTEPRSPAQGLSAGDYVVVSVDDDGPGMAQEVLARAFDPFYTTKPVGEGTGLGLSQVYGIARQSGGAAAIDSQPGRGTKVHIYLPVAGAAAVAAEAAASEAHGTLGGTRGAVLVVDDDPDVRRFIVDSLDSLGFRVLEAADGPSGLELFARERPDLLLLDFAMPGMTGAEVAERARRLQPDQRVLFASGYADTDAIEQAAGDAAVLRKPFRLTDLAAAVEGALA